MSNLISIQATRFTDISSGEKSYGYRIYDDYDSAYSNLLSKEEASGNDLDLLKLVAENENSAVSSMLEYVRNNENGIQINDTQYDWEEICEILTAEIHRHVQSETGDKIQTIGEDGGVFEGDKKDCPYC